MMRASGDGGHVDPLAIGEHLQTPRRVVRKQDGKAGEVGMGRVAKLSRLGLDLLIGIIGQSQTVQHRRIGGREMVFGKIQCQRAYAHERQTQAIGMIRILLNDLAEVLWFGRPDIVESARGGRFGSGGCGIRKSQGFGNIGVIAGAEGFTHAFIIQAHIAGAAVAPPSWTPNKRAYAPRPG